MGARAAAAVPALIDMLADASTLFWDGMGPGGRPTGGHFSARESARSALLGIGEPALKPLIDALGRHPDARVREGAAEVLSGLNNTQAIEPLIRALGDATIVMDGVRRASVLRDEGPTRVCDVAAQELVSMGAAAVGDALWVHHASNATPAVRERVLAVLVQRKDARTLPIVTKNLASASRQTRITAVNQMARLAPPDIVSVLLPLLKDSDLRVRAVAVERLGAAAVAAVSGSPEENRVVTALEALQRDALREVDRRVKAYQDSQDVLRIVDRTREALAAIAEKRKHRP
jgi:HEAT repeat protein